MREGKYNFPVFEDEDVVDLKKYLKEQLIQLKNCKI